MGGGRVIKKKTNKEGPPAGADSGFDDAAWKRELELLVLGVVRTVWVVLPSLTVLVFFFKQKTAYEIVSGDWSSDVCSSDLDADRHLRLLFIELQQARAVR